MAQSKLDDSAIASLYAQGFPSAEVGKRVGCGESTVLRHLRKMGIARRPAGKRVAINKLAFDEMDSEEAAYWLGFLIADGCVHYPKSGHTPQLEVNLGRKDRLHLEKLREFLGSGHKITETDTNVILSIANRHLCETLHYKWGVVPRKSHNFEGLPIIPEHLHRHMLRGLFDGDGHLGIRKDTGAPVVSIVGHWKCLAEVRDTFSEFCRLTPKLSLPAAVANGSVTRQMQYGSQADTSAIARYLYGDATVFLGRKKRVANTIVKRWGHVKGHGNACQG